MIIKNASKMGINARMNVRKRVNTEKAVWDLLSEAEGNAMEYAVLVGKVSDRIRNTVSLHSLSHLMRRHREAGFIVESVSRVNGVRCNIWKLADGVEWKHFQIEGSTLLETTGDEN